MAGDLLRVNGGLFSLLPVLATAYAGLYLAGCGSPRLTAQVYNDPPFNEKVSLSGLRTQAQAGSVVSMAHLGWRFDTGRGAELDEVAAANWYRKAADQGVPPNVSDLFNFDYFADDALTVILQKVAIGLGLCLCLIGTGTGTVIVVPTGTMPQPLAGDVY